MSIHSHRRTKAVGTLTHGGQLTCVVSLGRRTLAADNSSLRSSAGPARGIVTLTTQVSTRLPPGKPSRSAFLLEGRTMGPSSNTPAAHMSMHVAWTLSTLVSPTSATLPRGKTTVQSRSPYTGPAAIRPLSCLSMSRLASRCGTMNTGRKLLSRRCTMTLARIGRSRIAGSSQRTSQRSLLLKPCNADAQK